MKRASSLNHIYRLVWNAAAGAFVAVAENTNSQGKRTRNGRAAMAMLGAALAITGGQAEAASAALPTGGLIVQGQGSITQSGSTLTVNQTTGRMITNWNTFDIGQGQTVNFVQPNSSAVSLNRVVGGQGASQILGNMNANGQVWLINPGGVMIGQGAQINVAGIVASSANISDSDFMAGSSTFSGASGAVSNAGTINAQGGVVALIGTQVTNTGTINTPGGSTALTAADTVDLDFQGDGLVSVAVDKGTLNALVSNSGSISADGGSVTLSARAADDAISSVINNTGVIEAKSLTSRDGHIFLDNDATAGQTNVSGTLDVSSATGHGGEIDVTGTNVALTSATLDASGSTGGGVIKVGGGEHGADTTIADSTNVTVDAQSTLNADATTNGNGGQVTVWANNENDFAGAISVRGGAAGGNGGNAEVSGETRLSYTGVTDASAELGLMGTLLLDPTSIAVYGGDAPANAPTDGSAVYANTLAQQTANISLTTTTGNIEFHDLSQGTNANAQGLLELQPNVSFIAVTGTSGSATTHILFDNPNNTLEVSGSAYIYMQAGVGIASGTGSSGSVNPSGYIGGTGNNPASDQGVFNLKVDGGSANGESTSASSYSGNLQNAYFYTYLNGTYSIGTNTPGAGTITLLGADGLDISGSLLTHCGYVYLNADSDHGGAGNLVVSSSINTNGGDFNYAWGYSAGQTATFTYGSSVNTVCTDGSCVDANGDPKASGSFAAVAGEGGAGTAPTGATESANATILGGQLVVGGPVNLAGYQIHGGASIETDASSTITMNSTTALSPYVLNDTGAATTTTGSVDFTAGTVSIPSAPSGLSTTPLQLSPANTTANIFVSNADGVILGDGTVNRDGTVAGQNSGNDTTFLSPAGLALLQANNVQGLTIGNPASTGTIEVGLPDGTPSNFTFNAPGTVGIVGGTAVVNGIMQNTEGSELIQATDVANSAAQTATGTGTGNVVLTDNGQIEAAGNIVVAAAADPSVLGAGGNFVDDHDADASATPGLVADYGTTGIAGSRWLIYSTAPDQNVLGTNTNAQFKVYDATYAESDGTYSCTTAGVCTGTDVAAYDDRGQTGFNGTISDPIGDRADIVQILNYTQKTSNGYVYATPAYLTAELVGTVSKTYDGTTAVTTSTTSVTDGNGAAVSGNSLTAANIKLVLTDGTTGSVVGSLDQDDVSNVLTGADFSGATFDTKDVGTGKTVTITGIKLGVASNSTDSTAGTIPVYGYELTSTAGADTATGAIGTVTPALLTTATTVASKTYDGTTAATATTTLGGVIAGDTVTVSNSAQFSNANAGTQAVTDKLTLGGADAGDYVLASGTGTETLTGLQGTINQAVLTATAEATSKTYDGTTVDTLGNVQLAGLIPQDASTVTATGNGAFSQSDAGTQLLVTASASGLALSGTDAQNYTIGSVTLTTNKADINPAQLTAQITGTVTKVYDGSTGAVINPSNYVLTGFVAGQGATVTQTAGTYNSADVVTANTVSATLDASDLSANTGTNLADYVLPTSASGAATITPKSLTTTATAANKTYDGTTAATAAVTLSGVVAGDQVRTQAGSSDFLDGNVGTDKQVDVTGITLAGAQSSNYVLAAGANSDVTTATITPLAITGRADAASKTFDGNTSAVVTTTLTGVLPGDQVTSSATGAFTSDVAGTNKTVDIMPTLSGANAEDYVVSWNGQPADQQPVTAVAAITVPYSPVGTVAPTQGVNGTADTTDVAQSSIGNTSSSTKAGSGSPLSSPSSVLYTFGAGAEMANANSPVTGSVPVLQTSLLSANGSTSLNISGVSGKPGAQDPTPFQQGQDNLNLAESITVYRSQLHEMHKRGTYDVTDQGSDIVLKTAQAHDARVPDLTTRGGEWKSQTVASADGEQFEIRVRMLNDGTLVVSIPADLWGQGDEDNASYGLAVAKQSLGVYVQAVKSIVLQRQA